MNQAPCQRNKALKAPVDSPLVGGFSFRRKPMEEWRDVVGYEGLYKVSNKGRIKSIHRSNYGKKGKWKIIKGHKYEGYVKVLFVKKGIQRHHRVHRLELEAFKGPCPPGMEACHGDDIRDNNDLSNLRWGTHCDNMQDKIKNGNHLRGVDAYWNKLREIDVIDIRTFHCLHGISGRTIAKWYGVCHTVICNIYTGKKWKHI